MRRLVAAVIRGYQLTLSYWLGRQCRFQPSCSEYARQAVLKHGVGKGVLMGMLRVARCGPFGGSVVQGAFDPVPDEWHLPRCCKRKKDIPHA
ncbi:MAG: membrane protein insertion efficiency factor YidD [Pseudomonadaceae bacterium]|nr:membrane protein insertion efficiency factor YidD [Pseudomonadaceae bacterium]